MFEKVNFEKISRRQNDPPDKACADLENVLSGGPTQLFLLVDEERDPITAKNEPPIYIFVSCWFFLKKNLSGIP